MRGRAGLENFGKCCAGFTISVARPLSLTLSRKGRGDSQPHTGAICSGSTEIARFSVRRPKVVRDWRRPGSR